MEVVVKMEVVVLELSKFRYSSKGSILIIKKELMSNCYNQVVLLAYFKAVDCTSSGVITNTSSALRSSTVNTVCKIARYTQPVSTPDSGVNNTALLMTSSSSSYACFERFFDSDYDTGTETRAGTGGYPLIIK